MPIVAITTICPARLARKSAVDSGVMELLTPRRKAASKKTGRQVTASVASSAVLPEESSDTASTDELCA